MCGMLYIGEGCEMHMDLSTSTLAAAVQGVRALIRLRRL